MARTPFAYLLHESGVFGGKVVSRRFLNYEGIYVFTQDKLFGNFSQEFGLLSSIVKECGWGRVFIVKVGDVVAACCKDSKVKFWFTNQVLINHAFKIYIWIS